VIQLSKLSINKGFSQSQVKIIDKFLSAGAFIFITIALLIVATTPPATGYEISIYGAYPFYFWFFLIGTISCGIIILVHQAFSTEQSKWWIAGLLTILFANSIFLFLPEFRGYAFYGRGDTPTHLGHIKDILVTARIGRDNFYPLEHILGAFMVEAVGFSRTHIPAIFFTFFSGLYILNMFLLAKSISTHKRQVFLLVAFAVPLIYSFFHVNIHPNIFSIFLLPCLLSTYHRISCGKEYVILLIILIFSLTFFHPVTTLFAIAVFLTFAFSLFLGLKFRKNELQQAKKEVKNSLQICFILSLSFFLWYFSFTSIQHSFKRVFNWIIYQIGTPLFKSQLYALAEAELTPIQTIELFINRYGAIFLMLVVSAISFILVFHNLLRKKHVSSINFIYAFQFLMAVLIGITMLFGYFVEYNPVRVARLPLLMGTILSALTFSDITTRCSSFRAIILIAIIIAMAVLSIRSVYWSPIVCRINSQITKMEIAGTEWFERSKNSDILVAVNSNQILRRFEDYHFGVNSSSIIRTKIDPKRLPSHFSYDKSSSIAEIFDFQDRYMVMFKVDKVASLFFPENVRSKVYQWTDEDFAKLSSDPAAAQIYINGEFDVWRIYGK